MTKPTHERLIIVSDTAVRVQGDFGGGYTAPYQAGDAEARRRAILRAMVYLPDAKIIGLTTAEREEFLP